MCMKSLPIALDTDKLPLTLHVPNQITQPPRASILCFSSCRHKMIGIILCCHSAAGSSVLKHNALPASAVPLKSEMLVLFLD